MNPCAWRVSAGTAVRRTDPLFHKGAEYPARSGRLSPKDIHLTRPQGLAYTAAVFSGPSSGFFTTVR